MLGRFTFEDYDMGIPPLNETMGLPSAKSRIQTTEEMQSTLRLWVGATGGRKPH